MCMKNVEMLMTSGIQNCRVAVFRSVFFGILLPCQIYLGNAWYHMPHSGLPEAHQQRRF